MGVGVVSVAWGWRYKAGPEKLEAYQMPDGTMACQSLAQRTTCNGWLRSFEFGQQVQEAAEEHTHDNKPTTRWCRVRFCAPRVFVKAHGSSLRGTNAIIST